MQIKAQDQAQHQKEQQYKKLSSNIIESSPNIVMEGPNRPKIDSIHKSNEIYENKIIHKDGKIVRKSMPQMETPPVDLAELKEDTLIALNGIDYSLDKKFGLFILDYLKMKGNFCCRISSSVDENPKAILDQLEIGKRDNTVV